jgi:hypothetical protein
MNLALWLEGGHVLGCRFETRTELVFEMRRPEETGTCAGQAADQSGLHERQPYFATKLRDGLFFVDFMWPRERAETITLLLDLNEQIATILIGQLPDSEEAHRSLPDRIDADDELTAVSASFLSAAIDRPFTPETPRHKPTSDMVGRRIEYTYSPTERYEHIYLNSSLYTWHCLDGSEKGLADTDRCHYLKLAEDLYLFVWREKIVPTLGVVAVDFDALRTAGKILGYRDYRSGELANFQVGAHARVLNTTTYG